MNDGVEVATKRKICSILNIKYVAGKKINYNLTSNISGIISPKKILNSTRKAKIRTKTKENHTEIVL